MKPINFFNQFILLALKSTKLLIKTVIAFVFYQGLISFFVFGAYLFYSSISGTYTLKWNVLYLSLSIMILALSTPALIWMYDKLIDEIKDNSDKMIR
tara:strand:- start:696 stop:986 length:291 start_codon:yes stop_codon:yes gene_type:complete